MIFKAGMVMRSFEVETEIAPYAGADAAMDFPDGFDAGEWAVAQWGHGYGWGVEARSGFV